MGDKARHVTSTILLGLILTLAILMFVSLAIHEYQNCVSRLKFYDAGRIYEGLDRPSCSIIPSTTHYLLLAAILFEVFIFILSIKAFWKVNLNNKLIKISDVLNILIGIASVGWFILIVGSMIADPNSDIGFGLIFFFWAPFLLLIPSILFLIGYFKRN